MKFTLPKIYPLTDCEISGLSHTEQVARLIEGGAKFIQLREKNASSGDFFVEAEKAIRVAREQDVTIIINDRADLAIALKADGVHLGQDDLPPTEARKILGKQAIIGFSTHNIEQAIEALKFPLDYLAIGPIFQTSTKENPDVIVGIENLRRIREAIGDFPLVAIGGITFENFGSVLQAGADSVALVSALLNSPKNIVKIAKSFVESAQKVKLC